MYSLDYTADMVNEYYKKLYTTSTLVELADRPFSMQKLYNLQALYMKIRVYLHIV